MLGRSRSAQLLRVKKTPLQRSGIAIAYGWAGKIITVSLEMVLPGLAGLWLDRKLGTKVLFTFLGFGVGITSGIWHLSRMTQPPAQDNSRSDNENETRKG